MAHPSTSKRVVDSARAHLAKLCRLNPTELVNQINGPALDRLVHELPETIEGLQKLLAAAQQRQSEVKTRRNI